jgi:thiol-disulfide isomerase/thioredoxin
MQSNKPNPRFKTTWIAGAVTLVAAVLAMAGYLNRSEWDTSAPSLPVSVSSQRPVTNVAHPHPAPLFELPGPDGKLFKLESLKGNAVIVHFWASWCPPCLGEIPHWLEFASQWKGKPVKFVAVSLDQGWPEALKILPVSQLPENVTSVLDHDQKLPDLFGTYQYPETYLLDRNLQVVSKWVGAQQWGSPAIDQAIQAVLL